MAENETGARDGVRRRTVLLGAAPRGGALALGANTALVPAQAAAFVKGADISWLPQMEARGYYWNNQAGQRQGVLTILKGYGITAISLRTWVNPSNDPGNGHRSMRKPCIWGGAAWTPVRRCSWTASSTSEIWSG